MSALSSDTHHNRTNEPLPPCLSSCMHPLTALHVLVVVVVQAAVKEHYEENESDFNSCPSVNFVNLVSEGHLASCLEDTGTGALVCSPTKCTAIHTCKHSWRSTAITLLVRLCWA